MTSTPTPDLQGRLGAVGLIDLLQLAELGGYSARLVLHVQGATGEVRLQSGAVFEARCGHLQGSEALLALLRLKQGAFELWIQEPTGGPAQGEALRISSVLLEHLRLEDELLHLADTRLPPEQPLSLRANVSAPSEGEDYEQVEACIQSKPGVSLRRVAELLPLAPQRVELAVAQLHARGRLDLGVAPRPSTRVGLVSEEWLAWLLRWKQGRLRVLVACPAGFATRTLEQDLRGLQRLLKAGPFSFETSATGPSFVRLRAGMGEVLSMTFLPLSHKHRFLFQTFAQGMDLALIPGDLDASSAADLLPGLKPEHLLRLPPPSTPDPLTQTLRAFAQQQLNTPTAR
jgi:hypothetical protein